MLYRSLESQRELPFKPSELPITSDGKIYHLDLRPEQVSNNLLIVGDPERVPLIADGHFTSTEVDHEHRGLRTITGEAKETGQRVSVLTSGMGTPSLEIVLQELVALKEIDFQTLMPKVFAPAISIVRVGTSGGFQAETALGTPIIASYAIGLDNTGLFYDAPYPDADCERIERALHDLITAEQNPESRFAGHIYPYVARADRDLVRLLQAQAQDMGVETKVGLTVSNAGFFANQGRDVCRIEASLPDLENVLAKFDPQLGGQRIENSEMESSFLFHFMNGLDHSAASICPAIANRVTNTFATPEQIKQSVHNSTEIALGALARLEQERRRR
jgi:uridine phosphorylase